MHTPESSEYVLDKFPDAIVEHRKTRFVQFVEALVRLRELQYGSEIGGSIIARAKATVAQNLPSNPLRAAAIFVDHAYGFPANFSNFKAPLWVTAKSLLPESDRGTLNCAFSEGHPLEENVVVVLVTDLPVHGLHAGMAGIVRVVPEDDECGLFVVEFGEPESSVITVEVFGRMLRRPRPGDLLEHYRF